MYSYVPLLAEGFKVPLLKDNYEKIAADAKAENPDWNELSKRTIGLLSLEVIIHAMKKKITPEIKENAYGDGSTIFILLLIGQLAKYQS